MNERQIASSAHRTTERSSDARSSSLGLRHIFASAVASAKTSPTLGTLCDMPKWTKNVMIRKMKEIKTRPSRMLAILGYHRGRNGNLWQKSH